MCVYLCVYFRVFHSYALKCRRQYLIFAIKGLKMQFYFSQIINLKISKCGHFHIISVRLNLWHNQYLDVLKTFNTLYFYLFLYLFSVFFLIYFGAKFFMHFIDFFVHFVIYSTRVLFIEL